MKAFVLILLLISGCGFSIPDESGPGGVLYVERGWYIPAGGEIIILTPDPLTRIEQFFDIAVPLYDVVILRREDYKRMGGQ